MARRKEKWIQKAIKDPGSLREYVMRKYGSEGFTEKGTIKVEILRKLAKSPHVSEKTKRRARLALTLRKLRKR
ncbi:MAG: capsid protein VP2 [Archaeoglobaceae archaeon]